MRSLTEELIETKTAPPPWMGDKIRRDALLERLDAVLSKRLVLIHAPAGYGKTSLLSQWRDHHTKTSARIAWLTLDKEDSDPKRLVQYLWLATAELEGTGKSTRITDTPPDLPARTMLSAIVNRLNRIEWPMILIFDDLHRAEGTSVSDILKSLVRIAPRNCHFIIASRDWPELNQSLLAAEDQLHIISSEDLKFSEAEAEALLMRNQQTSLDRDDMQQIYQRTEGWPIALQLTSISLKRSTNHKQWVMSLRGSNSELASYLAEQVFMSLPSETQDIIIRTAIADDLTAELVNTLCSRQDGGLLLQRLAEHNVFLTPTSDDKQTYRYHQLFSEFLRERLANQDMGKYRSLQRIAARWFADNGNVVHAVNHSILSHEHELLAEIIESAGGWRMIPDGLQSVASSAMDALPESMIVTRPGLMLTRIYIAMKRGELGAARSDYENLLKSVNSASLPADLKIEIQVVGDVLDEYENVPMTLEDLLARESLLRTLRPGDHLVLGSVSESLAAKYYESGRLERAIEPILAAREHYQARGLLYSDLFTRFLEARIRGAQGRLQDATDILATARVEIENCFGDRSDLAANCAAYQAEVLYEKDDPQGALELLKWALPHMEQSDGWVDVYFAAYTTAARAFYATGNAQAARDLLASARRLARRRRLYQLELLLQLCELHLIIEDGQIDAAAREYASTLNLDELADQMAGESPVYRQVAVSASLCRAKLKLISAREDSAIQELNHLKSWSSEHGAGRLLIDIHILLAYGLNLKYSTEESRENFEQAVNIAMRQGFIRPFLNARRFIDPLLRSSLAAGRLIDRFRDRFLEEISRKASNEDSATLSRGGFSAAEMSVVTYLCRGYSNKEIAKLIGMSPDTVKYRLKSIFKKLGVSKRSDAVDAIHHRRVLNINDSPLPPGDKTSLIDNSLH